MGVEEKRCRSDGSAGLGECFWICAEPAHGFANLVFGDADDVVNISVDVFEVEGADALRSKTVGQRLRNLFGRERHHVSSPQAGPRIGSQFRLNPNYLHLVAGLRVAEFDGGGNAADQSASTDGDEHGFNGGQVFKDFKSYSPLSGNNFFVIVRRHDHVAMLGGQFFSAQAAFFAARTDEDDFRSECRGSFELVLGSIARHHDDGLHSKGPRRVGDSLCVIAAGKRNDAAATFLVSQRRDFVVSPTQFEGSDGLLVFELEVELAGVGRGCPLEQGSVDGDAVDKCVGLFDVVEETIVVSLQPAMVSYH